MRKPPITALVIVFAILLTSCSPRDFLTRRLAADLIATSDTFRIQQQFQLRLGVVANKDYLSPDYLALQHHGWISATNVPCPPALAPPPCWDVMLTASGVDTFQNLIAPGDAENQSITIPAAHYRSTVGFRRYDDGWRVLQGVSHPGQPLDEALKNVEPEQ